MKPLLLSTFDLNGGAFRAAYRLHRALETGGIDSRMLVQFRSSRNPTVIGPSTAARKGWALVREQLERLPRDLLYPNRPPGVFSFGWLPSRAPYSTDFQSADLVHLHWIAGGFLSIGDIARIRQPLVWTLHDMWAFTGGCHYTHGCELYETSCGNCPQLASKHLQDASRLFAQRKARLWQPINLTIICPSTWLADQARRSPVLRGHDIRVLPNALDTDVYKPTDRHWARKVLRLPINSRIVAIAGLNLGSNPLKGFDLARQALSQLVAKRPNDNWQLLVIGELATNADKGMPLPVHKLGHLSDDLSMALAYNAADVVLTPSRQDVFPQTATEPLACGVPVVAFETAGLVDCVEHKSCGFLARPFDPTSLAEGLIWTTENPERHQQLSENARLRATERWSFDAVSQAHLELYAEAIRKKDRQSSLAS